MKTMELRRVPYGTVFQAFGDEFVALDYIDGGVLAISRNIRENAAFDDKGANDLRTASIMDNLGGYLHELEYGGAKTGDILKMSIDLKTVDGTREYGRYETYVGLLTLEQYGKYQHIIQDVDTAWWLATPWRTPGEKFGGATYALYVDTNGYWYSSICSNSGIAIRPALLFSPSLLVSIAKEESGEAYIHGEYMNYVRAWLDETKNIGGSPMTYEAWKKDREAEKS